MVGKSPGLQRMFSSYAFKNRGMVFSERALNWELLFNFTPTVSGRLFSESLFPRNPPSYKYGLRSLFLEVHPKFHCAEMNVICLCQASHLRLYQ